jgi:predicted ATP-dependent Lon-type protease
MTEKLKQQCPICKNNFYTREEESELQKCSLKTDKYQIIERVELILKSSQDAYAKKVALFDFVKNIEVKELELSEEKRINCLLEGRLYNEIAKEKMKEYKKLTVEDFSKV